MPQHLTNKIQKSSLPLKQKEIIERNTKIRKKRNPETYYICIYMKQSTYIFRISIKKIIIKKEILN